MRRSGEYREASRRGAAGQDERLRELLLPDRAEHRLDSTPPVSVEGAAEVRDLDAGEAAQHPVDQPRGERASQRVLACAPPPARHVVAGLYRLDEPGYVLGRVLEVAVHRHDDVAAGTRQPRVHRRMLSEVALEAHRPNARIGAVQTLERRKGPVGRAVVDEDQLERARPRIERGDRAAVQLVERAGLVVDGDDDGKIGRRQIEVDCGLSLTGLRLRHNEKLRGLSEDVSTVNGAEAGS